MEKSELVKYLVKLVPELIPDLIRFLGSMKDKQTMKEMLAAEQLLVAEQRAKLDEALAHKFPEDPDEPGTS